MGKMICAVLDCKKKKHAKEYCALHYARFKRTGDPLKIKRTGTLESFWNRVEKTSYCWLWKGEVNNGYGKIATRLSPVPSGTKLAHRVSYELHVGPIPDRHHIDHLCRNKICVNPAHLEPVTPAENTRRGLHGVLRTHCNYGHELSGDNVIYDQKTNCRRCRTCSRSWARRSAIKNRIGNESYNKSRRKPCRDCGGEKGPGQRKKFCDACYERRSMYNTAGRGE